MTSEINYGRARLCSNLKVVKTSWVLYIFRRLSFLLIYINTKFWKIMLDHTVLLWWFRLILSLDTTLHYTLFFIELADPSGFRCPRRMWGPEVVPRKASSGSFVQCWWCGVNLVKICGLVSVPKFDCWSSWWMLTKDENSAFAYYTVFNSKVIGIRF
jgi:hypothetical protein